VVALDAIGVASGVAGEALGVPRRASDTARVASGAVSEAIEMPGGASEFVRKPVPAVSSAFFVIAEDRLAAPEGPRLDPGSELSRNGGLHGRVGGAREHFGSSGRGPNTPAQAEAWATQQ
jgi:hypothetical protein